MPTKKNRAEYMRRYRARKKADAAPKPPRIRKSLPDDPGQAFSRWCSKKLKVPPGHPRSGKPFHLPPYGVDFISDALSHRESLLCLGRKNAKSAVVAAFLLARLAGPLRYDGYRGGVASLSKEKAGELKMQMEQIAKASGLEGEIRFWRSPAPGRVTSSTGAVDILSADRSAGHASGFDDAICDEIGLFPANARGLVAGMRSSISARNGRFIALSVWGDSPFVPEIVARRNDPAVAVHLYRAAENSDLDDPKAWAAANPGIAAGIKSIEYMSDEARRVLATPADQADFRAYDLNLPGTPSTEMICSVADWKECLCPDDDLPPREGRCFVGIDLGGSSSMTSLVAVWENGRMETWGAFPDTPISLAKRGAADGCANLYERAHELGELSTYAGRVVPSGEFIKDCADRLEGCDIMVAGFDRYRKAEALQAMDEAGLHWPIELRGAGASAVADGSFDVRSFQKSVLRRELRVRRGLLLTSAIAESEIDRDARGNPALSKRKANARIDALSACVIACGLREKAKSIPKSSGVYLGMTGRP